MTNFRTDPHTGAPYRPAQPSMVPLFMFVALVAGGAGFILGTLVTL